MKVKEIMIVDVKTLASDTSAQEALDLLEEMQISGLPVVDKDGKLAGMFTEKEVLVYILPSYVEKVGSFIYADDSKTIKKKFAQLNTLKVGELMRREVVTAAEDENLFELAKTMLVKKARRIPVVDKSDKLLGIVARCDVLKALEKEAGANK